METENLIRFAWSRLGHNSTRKEDKGRLIDCLDSLNSGKGLDPTQQAFIESLKKETQERSRKYSNKEGNYELLEEGKQELLEELHEISAKLSDCIGTVWRNNSLDATQEAFLKGLGITLLK